MVQVPVSAVLVTIFSRYRDGDCCSCPDLPPGDKAEITLDICGWGQVGWPGSGDTIA